jgi:uncharacterized membrane protein YccC
MRQAPAHQFEWLDHFFILHALKVGLAGVLALFVAEALRLQYPEWSLFTVTKLMVVHYYPGSIALKSLFRFVGTLVGAGLGVWLVSDYSSAPVLFLSVTFLVMCFASYKVGHLRSRMAPYGYFLTGVTLIIVESTGLTQPDKEWFVALSRTEETFVGISVPAKTGSIRNHYGQLLRGDDRLDDRSDYSACAMAEVAPERVEGSHRPIL